MLTTCDDLEFHHDLSKALDIINDLYKILDRNYEYYQHYDENSAGVIRSNSL